MRKLLINNSHCCWVYDADWLYYFNIYMALICDTNIRLHVFSCTSLGPQHLPHLPPAQAARTQAAARQGVTPELQWPGLSSHTLFPVAQGTVLHPLKSANSNAKLWRQSSPANSRLAQGSLTFGHTYGFECEMSAGPGNHDVHANLALSVAVGSAFLVSIHAVGSGDMTRF